MPISDDYAKSFGQLANIVTGFAAAQTLAILLSLANGTKVLSDNFITYRWWIIGFTVLFYSLFAGAIWLSYEAEKRLLLRGGHQVVADELLWLLAARLVTVAMFGLLLIFVTLFHHHDQQTVRGAVGPLWRGTRAVSAIGAWVTGRDRLPRSMEQCFQRAQSDLSRASFFLRYTLVLKVCDSARAG